jgi:hypothetical protein
MDGEWGMYKDNDNACRILVEKFDIRRPFGRPGLKY